MKWDTLRKDCYDANMALPKLGLVLYTFGNVSCIDRQNGVVAIKPSGVDYEALTPEDIVIVGLDGNTIDGKLRPSSDTHTPLELYHAFPSIGGIVHTHSTFAVGWAQAARNVPIYGTTHADHLADDIPCTDFMPDDRIQNGHEKTRPKRDFHGSRRRPRTFHMGTDRSQGRLQRTRP